MCSFSFNSGSAFVASSDYMKRNIYIPQAHNQLDWFKNNITKCRISRIFLGWRSVFTEKKESDFTHALNFAISFIPVYSRKIFQHSSIRFELFNGRNIIVEYGAYNEHYDNSPYYTQIYYWNKEQYGLRMYEDPKGIFFQNNDYVEIQFQDHGQNFNQIIDHVCSERDFSKKNYTLIGTNCQRFCQYLISYLNGRRFPGDKFRGKHTLTFANIPAYIAEVLEDNENDEKNKIGYIPIIGDVIDKFRYIFDK